MNRAFGFPYGGFGGFGPFGPAYPFFPRRRLFPFFFLSPFYFPFFRGEDDRDGTYFTHHTCQEGDTFGTLASQYNVPRPILEAMNPHIQQPETLSPGTTAYIPRLDQMHCHKMYVEQEVPFTGSVPAYGGQQMMPSSYGYPGTWTVQQPAAPYGGGTAAR